jgi:predicted TIM-barrel fold metal-dependent hydrolase
MVRSFVLLALAVLPSLAQAQSTPQTATYKHLKKYIDAVPAIDTHDHLWSFDKLPGYNETEHGKGMNLAGIWRASYYTWTNPLTPWKPGQKFEEWWLVAKNDFADARATSFYRYQLPAFQDLYGIDFDKITDEQAKQLNGRIYRNYLDQRWLFEVVTQKANIELMFNDPYWARYEFPPEYPFAVRVLNVTPLVRGFHRDEFPQKADDPYHFAEQQKMKLESVDDYLAVLDRLFSVGKEKGCVCLKTTLAYQRTLQFDPKEKAEAARVFGQKRSALSATQIKLFEDFIMWRLVELSAKHNLPFQIHTGQARIQGSNPMLLVDMIAANPKTKFILFHGGYPWTGESAVVGQKYRNVWLDSCWLPTLSYSAAKRAYHEWLDAFPSNRIMWGADCTHAEGIYGATEFTRRAVAEVLAERVDNGQLHLEHAERIGRQIMRDNALELFPQLKDRLWKGKREMQAPAK